MLNLIKETRERISASNSKADSSAVKDTIKTKNRERNAAVTKANTAITNAVESALAKDTLGTENVISIVESVARDLGKALPSLSGFDPLHCSKEDIDILVNTMFAAGRFKALHYLGSQIALRLQARENSLNAGIRAVESSPTPLDVKLADEQVKAESRRSNRNAKAPALVKATA